MSDPLDINAALEGFDGKRMPTEVNHRIEGALMIARRYGMDPQYAIENQDSIDLLYDLTPEDYDKIRSTSPLSRNILGKEAIRQGGGVLGDVVQSGALGASDAAWASTEGAFGLLEESAKVNKTKQIGEELKQLGRSPTSNILFLKKQLGREDLPEDKRSEYQARLAQAQEDADRKRIYQELSAINPTEFVATVAGAFREVATEQRTYNEQYYTDRINPEFADSYAGKIAKGFGQMGFYIPAGVTGVGGMGAILSGSYQEAVDDYFQSQSIDKATATDEQRAEAARVGFMYALPASLLERAGLGPILSRLFKGSTGKMTIGAVIKRLSTSGLEGFVSEGGTEAAQQILQNTIARLSEYDPDREITAGTLESFIIGGFVGATGASGTQILNELDDYRINKEQNSKRTPLQQDDISQSAAGQVLPETIIPKRDGLADGINGKLIDKEFSMIGKRLSEEDIQGDPDPELIRRAFVEGDAQAQEQYNARRRPTYAETQAAQEAAKTDEQRKREADEAVLQIDGESDAFAIQMKNAFNLSDKEAVATSILIDAVALPKERILAEPEKAPEGSPVKGMVEFTADGKALVKGFETADVSTAIHESLAHPARRWLVNREVAQENRLGITDEDIRVAEEWAGAKDGNWTREAEEKFARGFERYLRDGKSPNARLSKVFEAMSQWLKQIYDKLKGSPVSVRITPEMRQVFDNLVTRSQRLRVEGRTEEASSMDALERMAREATETLDTLYQFDETLKEMDEGPSGEQGKSNKSKAQIDAETSLLLDEAFKIVGKGGLLTAAQRAKLKERSSQLNRSDERVARLRAALTEQRNRLEARMEKRRIEQVERLKSDFAKERIGVTDAIARMEALRKYFPPEVFGKISGFKNLTKIKGHEAQSRFVDQFATRLVEENEKHFKRILRERIEKRVKRIKSDIKAARAGRKKLPNQDAIISYLKRISLDTSTVRKQTENESLALLARLQDDNYEMSPEDMEIMGRASMISIGDPRTSLDTLRMVEADIERIQADGRTELEQRKATDKERFEALAAEISETIKRNLDKSGKPAFIENEIKRQGSRLKRMFWDTIRAETIAAWATGSRDSKLLNEVILPIGNANFKKKDRIHAFSKKLLRWYESENIPVSNISDTGNPVIQLGGNGTAAYGMTLDEAMWVYANSMNPYNREHLRNTVLSGGIHLSDTVIDGISNALPDNAKRVVHAYMEYTGTEQYDRLNTWFKDRHGVNMIKEESYFPIENLSRDGSAGDFFNDTTKRMLFNNGATKGRINSSLSFKGFEGRAGSFMNTVLRGTTNVEHMLNVQDVAFDTLRTLRDKNVRGQLERISPDAYSTLLDWLKRSASGRATLNESKIGAFLSGTLRRNASTAFVALNPASWLKVGASAPLALTEVKPGYILRSASNYAFNIKAVTGFVMENSDYMRHRPENLRLELSEMYEKAKAAYSGLGRNMSRWAKLQAKSFLVFEAFDMTQSTIIWKAKYDEVLNETGSHEDAVKKADMVVRTTQQTGRIEDLPALFAGGTIERLITQFTVDLNTLGNLAISKAVVGELDGISRKVAFASAGWILPVLILAMADATKDWLWEFIGWREPKDWDERKEQFGYDVVKYGVGQLTGYVPVFGRVIEAQAARAVGNNQEAYWLSSQSLPALAGIEQMARADSGREVVKGVNIIAGNPATNYIDEVWKQVDDEED